METFKYPNNHLLLGEKMTNRITISEFALWIREMNLEDISTIRELVNNVYNSDRITKEAIEQGKRLSKLFKE